MAVKATGEAKGDAGEEVAGFGEPLDRVEVEVGAGEGTAEKVDEKEGFLWRVCSADDREDCFLKGDSVAETEFRSFLNSISNF